MREFLWLLMIGTLLGGACGDRAPAPDVGSIREGSRHVAPPPDDDDAPSAAPRQHVPDVLCDTLLTAKDIQAACTGSFGDAYVEPSEGRAMTCHRTWSGSWGRFELQLLASEGAGLDIDGSPDVKVLGKRVIVRVADHPFVAVLMLEPADAHAAPCTAEQIKDLASIVVHRSPGSPQTQPKGNDVCSRLLSPEDVARTCGGSTALTPTQHEGHAGVLCDRRGEFGFAYAIERLHTSSPRSVMDPKRLSASASHGPWRIHVSNANESLRSPLCDQGQLDGLAQLLKQRLPSVVIDRDAASERQDGTSDDKPLRTP